MSSLRALLVLSLAVLCGCSGGGGGTTTAAAPWEKFRHDSGNTGQGSGAVGNTKPPGTPRTLSIDGQPILSSPAIALDGTVYVGTGDPATGMPAGTLAAVDPTSLTIKWKRNTCEACPSNQQQIGPLIASPAVFTLNNQKTILIGSMTGQLLSFTDDGTNNPVCTVCFEPAAASFGNGATISSHFVASPTFRTNSATAALATIFAAATVEVARGSATQTLGKLYALNSDGSLQWQFPQPNDPETIGAITASPVLGVGGTLLFTAGDSLYALGTDGAFLWRCGGLGCGGFPFGAIADTSAPFASSPAVSSLIYVATAATATAAGAIFAIGPDGNFAWRVTSPDGSGFVASVAVGIQAATTPTATPTVPVTPTLRPGEIPTATPTPTPTILPVADTVFAVTKLGAVVAIDAGSGQTKMLTNAPPPIAGPMISSPALSNDSFLVFGSNDGKLYAVNTATGQPPDVCVLSSTPCPWPVQLTTGVPMSPIRSSPAIAADGTVFVGADDGNLYAVGTQ
jgi:outer membrane protein assembly factor BamB